MEFGNLLDPNQRQHDFYGSSYDCKSVSNPSVLGYSDVDGASEDSDESYRRRGPFKRLASFGYDHAFLLTLLLQSTQLAVAANHWFPVDFVVRQGYLVSVSPWLLFAVVLCNVAQGLLLVSNLPIVMERAEDRSLHMHAVVLHYLTNTVGFASLYMLIFVLLGRDSFQYHPHTTADLSEGFHHVYVMLLYFSVSCTTGATIGEVYSGGYAVSGVVILQVLIAVVYHVAIFAFAVNHFQDGESMSALSRSELHASSSGGQGWLAWLGSNCMCSPRLLRITETKLFVPILGLIQALLLLALTIVDMHETGDTKAGGDNAIPATTKTAIFVSLWFFLAVVCLIVAASYNLIYHVREHHIVTPFYLAQCYVSTGIAFANLYFFLYLYNEENFQSFPRDMSGHRLDYHAVYWNALYFSMTTFTASNFGDFYPTSMTGRLVTGLQLLFMVVYHAIVLSEGAALLLTKFRVRKRANTIKAQKKASRFLYEMGSNHQGE